MTKKKKDWRDDSSLEWVKRDPVFDSAYEKFSRTGDDRYIDDADVYDRQVRNDSRMKRQKKVQDSDGSKNNNN